MSSRRVWWLAQRGTASARRWGGACAAARRRPAAHARAVSMSMPGVALGFGIGIGIGMFLLAAGPAHAVRARDTPPPTAESVRGAHPSRTAADLGRVLRDGTVTSVEAETGRVLIDGVRHRLLTGFTRLYRLGQRVDSGQLSPGQRVRFSIAPQVPNREDALEVLLILPAGGDGGDAR